MSSCGLRRRVASLVLVAAFASMAAKGLCFMPAGTAEAKDAHACCKKGWRTAPPACCMDGQTEGAAAFLVAKHSTPAPVLEMSASGEDGLVAFEASARPLMRLDRTHSPPTVAILRI